MPAFQIPSQQCQQKSPLFSPTGHPHQRGRDPGASTAVYPSRMKKTHEQSSPPIGGTTHTPGLGLRPPKSGIPWRYRCRSRVTPFPSEPKDLERTHQPGSRAVSRVATRKGLRISLHWHRWHRTPPSHPGRALARVLGIPRIPTPRLITAPVASDKMTGSGVSHKSRFGKFATQSC